MKNTIITSLFWKFGERIIAQCVSFIVSIILARLLMPEDYGVISILLVFINIANVFVVSGLSSALIQDSKVTENDFSTMFWCNMILSFLLYIVLYISAPLIADFYNDDSLINLLRVLSLMLFIASYKSIEQAYISKKMEFKKFFFATIGGTIFSAFVGIIMAYYNFGAWALVGQYLSNAIIDTIILQLTIKWRPSLVFNPFSAKKLTKYGWKIMLGELLSASYNEIRNLVIGKVYSKVDLAYYSRGEQFPKLITTNINSSLIEVLFPALSNFDGDNYKVYMYTKKAVRMSSYIIFPLTFGMLATAEPIIRILLTEKWLFCVPYMRLACISYALIPINSANIQSIKAMGRSDYFLKLEIIKKTIGIISIFIAMKINVMAIAISTVLVNVLAVFINVYPNRKLINYGIIEQVKDTFIPMIFSGFMAICVYSISILQIPDLALLVLQVLLGIIIYALLSYFLKIKEFNEITNLIKKAYQGVVKKYIKIKGAK